MSHFGSDSPFHDPDEYPFQLRSTATRAPITNEEKQLRGSLLDELRTILDGWNNQHETPGYDPLPVIVRIAEIIEIGVDEFLKRDPDPLDDRHPHRTHPESAFGNLLKMLFRNDDFMNKLVVSYILGRDKPDLSAMSCRLLLDCVPGLDSNVVFSEPDDFVPKLYTWAKDSSHEMLQAYAMGLLAAALEVQENASKFRADNTILVPIALRRLKELKEKMETERPNSSEENTKEYPFTSFAHLINDDDSSNSNSQEAVPTVRDTSNQADSTEPIENKPSTSRVRLRAKSGENNEDAPPRKRRKAKPNPNNSAPPPRIPSFSSLQNLDNSNSRWDILQPFVIGTHKIFPLTLPMYQRLILQYLGPTGEYQDLLSMTYEGNAMDLIIDYIDLEKSQDVRLTFDALKYLTSLLVHRKFALEFVSRGGVASLLKIPRSSLASVGVVTCLYYISYNTDVMENVCLLDEKIVDEIVDYVLWCLEHNHESGMASASMFFTHAVYYKAILDRFDQRDGPRKLYNYISTLSLIQDQGMNELSFELSEEQLHTSTQCVRNACSAFRSYVAAHMFLKLEQVRRTIGSKHFVGLHFPTLLVDLPSYKSMRANEEHLWESQKVLSNILRVSNASWRAIDELRKLGVIKTMISVHILSKEWNQATGRTEMSFNALEVVGICCCLPKCQLELLDSHSYEHTKLDGILALLDSARNDDDEGGVRIAALKVLIVCVCVHPEFFKKQDMLHKTGTVDRKDGRKSSKGPNTTWTDHLDKMWTVVRRHAGIMILNEIIHAETPLTDADNLRTNACVALAGLAQCQPVRQILTKMPLIANNELQGLMREPVVQDKRAEHVQFCREALVLLETVTGKSMKGHAAPNAKDLTQEKMHKQWIVTNTKINYNSKELLQVIHEHLQRQGLTSTAALLRTEANLPDVPASRVGSTPAKLNSLPHDHSQLLSIEEASRPTLLPRGGRQSEIGGISSSSRRPPSAAASHALFSEQVMTPNSGVGGDAVFATPTFSRVRSNVSRSSASPFRKKFQISPMKPRGSTSSADGLNMRPFLGLDDILTEYFRTQHSQCTNPVTTCPPFSLFYPHRCPEKKTTGYSSGNLTRRQLINDILRPHGRAVSALHDERYVFSRFRPQKIIHEHEETYTKCAFSIDDEHLIVGLFSGELHWMNIESGIDESTTSCHNSAITNIQPSYDGTMLLTSSAYVRPLSALWRLGDTQEMITMFNSDSCVKFSNLSLDRIVGTHGAKATIYDTETSCVLNVFESTDFDGQRFYKNVASFSPDDHLIFNDGVLWDVRQPNSSVFTFDMLTSFTTGGVFHPHGNQIIINTCIWDVRANRLLRHVPALDQCHITFNSTGNIMYASITQEADQEYIESFATSFRTFDTSDYSVITTVDTKKTLLGVAADHQDKRMSVIERLRPVQNEFTMQTASQVRVFEVGKQKDAEDDADEGDEEEERDDDNSDGSSDTSSDLSLEGDSDEDSIGVFEAIGRLGDESNMSFDSDESESSESDHDGMNESESDSLSSHSSDDSSGWETDSGNGDNQAGGERENGDDGDVGRENHGGARNEGGGNEGGNGGGDRSRRSGSNDSDEDEEYEPEVPNDFNSTSSIPLNPHLRRQNRWNH